MNKMENIAKLLDVKMDEVFELEGCGDALFKITENGFMVYNYVNGKWEAKCEHLLVDILTGKEKILKKTRFMLDNRESILLHKTAGNNWITTIAKHEHPNNKEYIFLKTIDEDGYPEFFSSDSFEKGTMFSDLETNVEYSGLLFDIKKQYKIAVAYQKMGYIDVCGDSIEDAIGWAKTHLDELPLPKEETYLEKSYEIDEESSKAAN